MLDIKVDNLRRYKEDRFLFVRQQSPKYQLNERYHFKDYAENSLGVFYLASMQVMKLKDINNHIAFLDKNCNKQTYKNILIHQYGAKLESNIYVMVFTNQNTYENA